MSNPFINSWRSIVTKLTKPNDAVDWDEVEWDEVADENSAEVADEAASAQLQTANNKEVSEPSASGLNAKRVQQIETRLAKWLDAKGYCSNEVTIQSLATELYTNRTYLSAYINALYGCTFKVWVTHLRIDEAKRMLCDSTAYTVAAISESVGFSSTTSFIHVFKKYESISPAQWRERHKAFRAALMPLSDEE